MWLNDTNNNKTNSMLWTVRHKRHENFVTNIRMPDCAIVQTLPYNQRCQYVRDSGQCEERGFIINYVDLLFCQLAANGEWSTWLGMVLLLLICIYLFAILACTADSYFCPSLNVLAHLLGLNENVAGVTLLAFGNSAPDLFTGLAGLQSNTRTVLSDCFGATIFVVLVVGGSILLVMPFDSQPGIFMRDCCFLILDVLFIEYITMSGKQVSVIQSSLYLSIYLFYIIVIIIDQYMARRTTRILKRQMKLLKEPTSRHPIVQLEGAMNPNKIATSRYKKERAQLLSQSVKQKFQAVAKAAYANPSSPKNSDKDGSPAEVSLQPTLSQNLEDDTKVEPAEVSLQPTLSQNLEDDTKVEPARRSSLQTTDSSNSDEFYTAKDNSLTDIQAELTSLKHSPSEDLGGDIKKEPITTSSSVVTSNSVTMPDVGNRTSISLYAATRILLSRSHKILPKIESCESFECLERRNIAMQGRLTLWQQFSHKFNPIDDDFKQSGFCRRVFTLFKWPLHVILMMLIPVVDHSKPLLGWSKLLNCLQLIALPTFMAYVLAGLTIVYHLPIFVWVLLSSLPFALLVFCITTVNTMPNSYKLFSIIGAIGSIFIIYLSASEIINILEVIGIITDRSNSFLGCTLLAWGNGLGDLVTNTAVARQGYPKMAFAACFGGPLFSTTVTIGISYLYIALYSEDLAADVGQGVMGTTSVTFLIISLWLLLFGVTTANFSLRRSMGFCMIIMYFLYMIYAVLSEWEIIHPYGSDHRLDLKPEPLRF